MATNPKFVSLFCGCGGMDLGFINAGFQCIAAFDNDRIAVEVHRQNLGNIASILDLSSNSFPSDLKDIDVLIAGPPCQGFSTAGKRSLDDPRNSLLYIAAKIAGVLKPKIVVVENVNGVATGEHKKYWLTLRSMFVAVGYHVIDLVLNSNKIGVPQLRKRRLTIAWNNQFSDKRFELKSINGGTLRSALKGILSVKDHEPIFIPKNSDNYRIVKRIKPGQKLCNVRGGDASVHTWDIPEVFGVVSPEEREVLETIMVVRRRERRREFGDADPVMISTISKELGYSVKRHIELLEKKGYLRKVDRFYYDLKHSFNGKYRRLLWDKPSYTVDTRFGDPRYFLHPKENRGFSVREAARIQGFPDGFMFIGSKRKQYELIGNAVPPILAENVAIYLRQSFFT